MKRVIKFRIWDNNFNEYTSYHLNKALCQDINKYERFLFEQFIGLIDKNGKDIYEGDIVKPFSDDGNTAQIIFMGMGFGIYTQKKNGDYIGWTYFKDEIEVIGNIHENPELIKN